MPIRCGHQDLAPEGSRIQTERSLLIQSCSQARRHIALENLSPRDQREFQTGVSVLTVPGDDHDREFSLQKVAGFRNLSKSSRTRCSTVPEGERVAILAGVRESKAKVEAELDGMPFVKHTLGLRLRHDSLKKELDELDAAECAARAQFGRAIRRAIRRKSAAIWTQFFALTRPIAPLQARLLAAQGDRL